MKSIKMLATTVIAFLLTINTIHAQAIQTTNIQDDFVVKFAGIENDYLVFEVQITGNNLLPTTLKINDKIEGELYEQNWKPKTAVQIFKIEKNEGQELSFKLQLGTKSITKTFSTTTRLIENTTITENELVSL